MAISVDLKAEYDKDDVIYVSFLFATISLGILIQIFNQSGLITNILFMVASSLFSFSMYLGVRMIRKAKKQLRPSSVTSSYSAKDQFHNHVLRRKIMLLKCLLVLLPPFPIIYVLSMFHVISSNARDAVLLIASAVAKMLFASICTDARLEITHPSVYMLEVQEKANVEKRSFLRYIFHEMRVPLNTISLGVQHLTDVQNDGHPDANCNDNAMSDDDDDDSVEKETLGIISGAASFMGDVLNDVLAIQKIEEGVLKLIFKPFVLSDLLDRCVEPFYNKIHEKRLQVKTVVDEPVKNVYVKGDKYRLNNALMKILCNAIDVSPPFGHIVVSVSAAGAPYESRVEIVP